MEKDPHRLASHVCGSNYRLEGEDIELRPKEEYPDWLWTINVERPKPTSEELEKGRARRKNCDRISSADIH